MSSETEASEMPAIAIEQESERVMTDTAVTAEAAPAEPEPTFQTMWDDITEGITDDVVRLYREANTPFVPVWSKQKGNVHFRVDIHPRSVCRHDSACPSWQRPKQPKANVTEAQWLEAQQAHESKQIADEPTADEVEEDDLEPEPQETRDQSD
jgi:hypothetical protein